MANNEEFKVGDKVSWGFNGDYNPGEVVKVSKGYVEIVELDHHVTDESPHRENAWCNGLRDGDEGVTFTRKSGVQHVKRFTKRAVKGKIFFQEQGISGVGWVLHHGASWSRNPSF
jgi:hypothetical protein